MNTNPYQRGAWESRQWEMVQASKAIREDRLQRLEARFELESDEFQTAREKAIQLERAL